MILAGSYIEVSLDAQHLWLYKDGTLVTETDIVSGAPTPQRETMRGAWPIAYKASPYTLTSDQYGYNTKVTYWMPFVYGQGLHDATWQSSFGGNRYKSGAGSHGCINLPKDQAALIYNTIDGGYSDHHLLIHTEIQQKLCMNPHNSRMPLHSCCEMRVMQCMTYFFCASLQSCRRLYQMED